MIQPEEQLKEEAELARLLKAAPEAQRRELYGSVYDRIYEMHFSRAPEVLDFGASLSFLPILLSLTDSGAQALEIGCGTGLLAVALAREGRRVLGIDVSSLAISKALERAESVEGVAFERTVGLNLPREANSVDFAWSVEVLEHLHEGDVAMHLHEVARVLKPGGQYWILTPNRLARMTASERFGLDTPTAADDVHLKEWTYRELGSLLRRAGFDHLRCWRLSRRLRKPRVVPMSALAALERLPERWLVNSHLRAILELNACSIVARRGVAEPESVVAPSG